MKIEIFSCPQGSDEWHALRRGIPTASEFKSILAKGKGLMRKTYMYKLAGEVLTGEAAYRYTNDDMERGKVMEAEARDRYRMRNPTADLTEVGFIKATETGFGDVGASPDRLIGDDGGLEIKTSYPHLLIEHLLSDEIPPEHYAQVQGNLWISQREWWDLVIYWPGMRPFTKRVYRDEPYIKMLADEVIRFNTELHEVVRKIGVEA